MRRCSALALLLLACDSSKDGPLGSEQAPVIGGIADESRGGVVAIFSQRGKQKDLCSGVLVHQKDNLGWVLTAAHCVVELPPKKIIVGNDYSDARSLSYEVVNVAIHPSYVADPKSDFALIVISGLEGLVPTYSALLADSLAVGEVVQSCGFGRTTLPDVLDSNTRRNCIDRPVLSLTTSEIRYDLASGGICYGDSGGGLFVTRAGQPTLVGMHQSVIPRDGLSNPCEGFAVSGRVSLIKSWMDEEFTKLPSSDCNLCRQTVLSGAGSCASVKRECEANSSCNAIIECSDGCQNSNCLARCIEDSPSGKDQYQRFYACACTTCSNLCNDSVECTSLATCGVPLAPNSCTECLGKNCCGRLANASRDPSVKDCADGKAGACNTSNLRALETCRDTACSTECHPTIEVKGRVALNEPETLTPGGGCSAGPFFTQARSHQATWGFAIMTSVAVILRRMCAKYAARKGRGTTIECR